MTKVAEEKQQTQIAEQTENVRQAVGNANAAEEQKCALKQTVAGIIPEWRQRDEEERKKNTGLVKLHMEGIAVQAMTHMNSWRDSLCNNNPIVQERWDNRGGMRK
eukprot:3348931-Pleurochrysis_carterae.AAC.2